MKRICEVCGEEYEEAWMMSYNSGVSRHWLCWPCWKQSQGEAAGFEMRRRRAKAKEANRKK